MIRRGRTRRSGFTLAGLLILMAVMSIGLLAAEQAWSTVRMREREEELIFRGEQYVSALYYHYKKVGTYPVEMEQLTKKPHRFIRQLYPDPITGDGEWYIVRVGDPKYLEFKQQFMRGGAGKKQPELPKGRQLTPGSIGKESSKRSTGPIWGVVSGSEAEGFRSYYGRQKYSEWFFVMETPNLEDQRRQLRIMRLRNMLTNAPQPPPRVPLEQPLGLFSPPGQPGLPGQGGQLGPLGQPPAR
jgi:type II secretory pathway pseudopilin PulG